jgi:hypothetical protein
LGENIFGKIVRFGWSRGHLGFFLIYFGKKLFISKRKRGILLFSPDIIATGNRMRPFLHLFNCLLHNYAKVTRITRELEKNEYTLSRCMRILAGSEHTPAASVCAQKGLK